MERIKARERIRVIYKEKQRGDRESEIENMGNEYLFIYSREKMFRYNRNLFTSSIKIVFFTFIFIRVNVR